MTDLAKMRYLAEQGLPVRPADVRVLLKRYDEMRDALRSVSETCRECETEYDGRIYILCTDCGTQLSEGRLHSPDCAWSIVDAALAKAEGEQPWLITPKT